MSALTNAREKQADLKKELGKLEKERAKIEDALSGKSFFGSEGLDFELAKARKDLLVLADYKLKNDQIAEEKIRPGVPLADYLGQLAKCRELEDRIVAETRRLKTKEGEISERRDELRNATQRVQTLEDTQSARSHELIKQERALPSWGASRNLEKQQKYADKLEADAFKEGMKKDVAALLIGGGVVGLMFGVPLVAVALLVIIGGVMLNSGLKGEKKAEYREAYSAKMTGQIIDGEVENRKGMGFGV